MARQIYIDGTGAPKVIGNTSVTQPRVSYSAQERLTGETWIDGRPVYRKTVSLGSLPNAAEKQVAHGIAGLNDLVRLEGAARAASERLSLPFTGAETLTQNIMAFINNTHIRIVTGIDRSDFLGQLTIYYTKV